MSLRDVLLDPKYTSVAAARGQARPAQIPPVAKSVRPGRRPKGVAPTGLAAVLLDPKYITPPAPATAGTPVLSDEAADSLQPLPVLADVPSGREVPEAIVVPETPTPVMPAGQPPVPIDPAITEAAARDAIAAEQPGVEAWCRANGLPYEGVFAGMTLAHAQYHARKDVERHNAERAELLAKRLENVRSIRRKKLGAGRYYALKGGRALKKLTARLYEKYVLAAAANVRLGKAPWHKPKSAEQLAREADDARLADVPVNMGYWASNGKPVEPKKHNRQKTAAPHRRFLSRITPSFLKRKKAAVTTKAPLLAAPHPDAAKQRRDAALLAAMLAALPIAQHAGSFADQLSAQPAEASAAVSLATAVESRLLTPVIPAVSGYELAGDVQSLGEVFSGSYTLISAISNASPLSRIDYGPRGRHPYTGAPNSWHDGWDLAAPLGTELTATAPGTVRYYYQDRSGSHLIENSEQLARVTGLANIRRGLSGYGLYAVIEFEGPLDGFAMRIGHLSAANAALLDNGGRIEAGTVFGNVGESGGATGPHAHLETLMRTDNVSGWHRLLNIGGSTYAPFDPSLLSQATETDQYGRRVLDPVRLTSLATADIAAQMPLRERSRLVVARRVVRPPVAAGAAAVEGAEAEDGPAVEETDADEPEGGPADLLTIQPSDLPPLGVDLTFPDRPALQDVPNDTLTPEAPI